MSRFVLTNLIVVLLLTTKSMCAFSEPTRWEIAGEWLYFISAINQPNYVGIDDEGTAGGVVGTLQPIKQNWHSGYRVELAHRSNPCGRVKFRWTHFHNAIDKSSVGVGASKVALLNWPGFASFLGANSTAFAKNLYNYYYADLLYEFMFYQNPCLIFELVGGVQFSRLDIKQKYLYTAGATGVLFGEIASHLRSVGPELGLSFSFSFNRYLSLRGRALGAFLISQKTAHIDQRSATSSLEGVYDEEKYYISNFFTNARLGLAGNFSPSCFCSCINISVEAGYELVNFSKGYERIFFYDSTRTSNTINLYQDFTLHGPYARLSIEF